MSLDPQVSVVKEYLELMKAARETLDRMNNLHARTIDLGCAIESGVQDGLLSYYREQAKASDVNVESRIGREPFDFRTFHGR